jgi:hypothetical protein
LGEYPIAKKVFPPKSRDQTAEKAINSNKSIAKLCLNVCHEVDITTFYNALQDETRAVAALLSC